MRCQECRKETDIRHLRQCQEADCDDVLCSKCLEIHEMDHRHNDDERAATKYLDAAWAYTHSLMFRRLPVAFIFLLLVAGTHVALDVGMDGVNVVEFNLPALGRIAAVSMIFVLLPQAVLTGAMSLLMRFTKPLVPEWMVESAKARVAKMKKTEPMTRK